ncbi:MAG: DNA-processing protein DprA [Tissierellia bacterium]|nr:DNA-processing protein DprA [Tissierellia bacterium]
MILNIINISNNRIVKFIKEDRLLLFQNLDQEDILNISNFSFLKDLELTKIIKNFHKIDLDKVKNRLDFFSIKYVTILDEAYPQRLINIYDPPAILYFKGDLSYLDNSLALVGSRKPSPYGIWATKKIVQGLSIADISIVSGMALGIDRIAHESAIEAGLKTVGVLASSIDIQYPRSNMDLYGKMHDQLLVSEHCLNVYPLRLNFVLRNRLISGLSLGVLVAEASQKSGSLITANYALDQGRDVFAIPGQIDSKLSQGTNDLIKRGAKLISGAEDILEEYPFLKELDKVNAFYEKLNLTDNSLKIIRELKSGNKSINYLSFNCGIKIEEIYSILINLEMKGLIYRVTSDQYGLKI